MLQAIARGPRILGWSRLPILMRAGMVLSALFAGIWIIFIPLAFLNIGTYRVSGRAVTGHYFLIHVYPLLLPMIALLVAIAYGFWMERRWARSLSIWFWLSLGFLLVLPSGSGKTGWPDVAESFASLGSFALMTGLYFYGKCVVLDSVDSILECTGA